MELLDVLRLLRRRWRLIAACTILAATIAWVITPARPTNRQVTWRADHQLLRNEASPSPAPALAQVALFVKSGEVPKLVAERLDFEGNPGLLAQRIRVTLNEGAASLTISATGTTRADAAEVANAFAEATLAYFADTSKADQSNRREAAIAEADRLNVELDSLEDQIEAAESAGSSTAVLDARRDATVRQYALALDQIARIEGEPPPSAGYTTLAPAAPELARPVDGGFTAPQGRAARTLLATALGLALGLAAAFAAERLDPRVHTSAQAEEAFGLPVVAEVPHTGSNRDRAIFTVTDPLSSVAEAYRSARAAVLLAPVSRLGPHRPAGSDRGEASRRVVLVTSASPNEAKTTSVANLAAGFAETGRSVLVLGCDFRRPEIHRYLHVPAEPGLSDVLAGSRQLHEVVRRTDIPGVALAPSGPDLRNRGDLATHGHSLIEQAREMADIVLIDTAPALATTDVTELITSVDTVLVVCRSGRTRSEQGRRLRVLLERMSTPVTGIVLVGLAEATSGYESYYTTTAPAEPRARLPLGRGVPAKAINERLEPWTSADRGGPAVAPRTGAGEPGDP